MAHPTELDMPLVFTAQSKREFYCRDAVCEYVLRQSCVPINPFRVFDYFLGERIDREVVRLANQVLIAHCDEVWSFGARIADGVLNELRLARHLGKRVKLFTIDPNASAIRPIEWSQLHFEDELRADRDTAQLLTEISGIVSG